MQRRTTVGIVLRPDFATVQVHERACDGQPQTHAVLFGGEERVEDPIELAGRNTVSPIAYREHDLSGFELRRGYAEAPLARRDLSHRIHAIKHEIEQHLLDMYAI